MKKLPKHLITEFSTLPEKIEKEFKKFRVYIDISEYTSDKERVCYKVQLKRNTTAKKLRYHAQDVQDRLGLRLFQVCKKEGNLYIVASDKDVAYPRLLKILNDDTYHKALKKMNLPYVVGHNALGQPVIVDLKNLPHLLLGGSSNSGKSVGLQVMIASTAYIKLPSEVNMILIDVGAGDLMEFDGIPHLSRPVIHDYDDAYYTLIAVKDEMERRIALEHTNSLEYEMLPRLILVIDEFPALFIGQSNKETSRVIAATVSSLLQRGRHAKIHVVLAAQNPTIQNMKADLANITARIAFRCAKKNFSETILGEGGAENLSGSGSLLLKSPESSDMEWIQGIYIKPRELRRLVQDIKNCLQPLTSNKFELVIPDCSPTEPSDTLASQLSCTVVKKGPSKEDTLFASVILWALGQDSISINALMKNYSLGWNSASRLVERLEEMGIVGRLKGKAPREVVPENPEDLPAELITFLENIGHSQDTIIEAFCNRTERQNSHQKSYSSNLCL